MKFITESEIEKVLDKFENTSYFDKLSKALIEEQPNLISYFESESFEILTEEEKDILWYCALVIYGATIGVVEDIAEIQQEVLNNWEEINYNIVGDNMKFMQMTDSFFEKYPQEDLLAFVEDTLIPDEEDIITPVGRKILFLSLKTFIDALDDEN